jgi:site-specific DNA-methyltransferase (adenine-specific)
MFKYDWIWKKSIASNFMNAKNAPMTNYETISIFSEGKCANKNLSNMPYYPQGLIDIKKKHKGRAFSDNDTNGHRIARPSTQKEYVQNFTNFPRRLIEFKSEAKTIHPTQKPVALLEYLIKTYTLENETVLDFTMGSGSTGVACKNLNRKFIGIEKDDKYFKIAKNRIFNE